MLVTVEDAVHPPRIYVTFSVDMADFVATPILNATVNCFIGCKIFMGQLALQFFLDGGVQQALPNASGLPTRRSKKLEGVR
jgi:hypothetical protein